MIVANPARIIVLIALLTHGSVSRAADEPDNSQASEVTAVENSIAQQQEIANYRNQLADLESEFGVYDQRLLESLRGLTEVLIEAGEFEDVDDVLERRLLLLRTIAGPENLDQLPITFELIGNDIRLQDWESVVDRYEFIYWLNSQDENVDVSTLLNAKSNLVDWLLASVYFESSASRVSRFMAARQLHRENLSLAEKTFDEDSWELIPWLYKHAVLQHQVYAFLKSEDELGYDARLEISRREGRGAANYLREGLNTVKRIRRIIETRNEPETEAMAMIAEADFQMLMSLGTAARLYRSAEEKLKEAGLPVGQIESFFLRPVVLPADQFHFTLQSALDGQARYVSNSGADNAQESEDEHTTINIGEFTAWSQSLPFSRRPQMPPPVSFAVTEMNQVDLVFSVNSRGKSTNPKLVRAEPDQSRIKRDARDAVREMQFRPRFVDGRWRRVDDVSMRYLFVPPQ